MGKRQKPFAVEDTAISIDFHAEVCNEWWMNKEDRRPDAAWDDFVRILFLLPSALSILFVVAVIVVVLTAFDPSLVLLESAAAAWNRVKEPIKQCILSELEKLLVPAPPPPDYLRSGRHWPLLFTYHSQFCWAVAGGSGNVESEQGSGDNLMSDTEPAVDESAPPGQVCEEATVDVKDVAGIDGSGAKEEAYTNEQIILP